ncbi:MAG: hypothetical protein RLW62_24630 [Gammaproteobacteria bacterium]
MKNLIIALSLTVLSNGAFADTFAPWETRMAPATRADAVAARPAPSGFAPWRDRAVTIEMPDALPIGAVPPSVFRPWS